jgi:hypothetical protein
MERSDALRTALPRVFDRFPAGDLSAFDSVVSSADVLFIGTGRNERGTDREHVRRGFQSESFLIEPRDPQGRIEGSMGWETDEPILDVPSTGKIRVRRSAVFRFEDGEWRLVMSHLSIGVPDEAAAALAGAAVEP